MVDFTTEQQLPFTLALTDGRGRPKDFEGEALPVSSDETVATVSMTGHDTGMIVSVAPGAARIAVTVDADLGEGIQTVVGLLDVNVTLDERTGARIMALTPGAAEDKPV